MHPIKEECNSFYYAFILIGLLLKRENYRATNGVITQQEVKCTPNNQCKCTVSNEKGGMLLCEMQNFPSNEKCNPSYMKIWLILLQANLVQVPCKMQNAIMHNDAKKQIFLYFLN